MCLFLSKSLVVACKGVWGALYDKYKKKGLSEVLQVNEKEKVTLEKQSIRLTEGVKKDRERLEDENKIKNELDKKLNEVKEQYDEAKLQLKIENVDEAMEEVRKKERGWRK